MIAYLYQYKGIEGPFLIICPLAVVTNWKRELLKWLPDLRAEILMAKEDEREECLDNVIRKKDFDIIITSFEGAVACIKPLKRFTWEYLVIDEAHRIKNEKSRLALECSSIKKNRTLLLTGTPLQNDLHELWALLNFLMPHLFDDPLLFDKLFESCDGKKPTKEEVMEKKKGLIKQLHAILHPFMLRRVKADCLGIAIPAKKEIYLYVPFTPIQKQVYKN